MHQRIYYAGRNIEIIRRKCTGIQWNKQENRATVTMTDITDAKATTLSQEMETGNGNHGIKLKQEDLNTEIKQRHNTSITISIQKNTLNITETGK